MPWSGMPWFGMSFGPLMMIMCVVMIVGMVLMMIRMHRHGSCDCGRAHDFEDDDAGGFGPPGHARRDQRWTHPR
jgi:uncharacterized membrane protein